MLAFKMYSFDTDSFIEDIICYSNKSIILVFDFDKITVQYKPSNINFEKTTVRYCRTKNSKLNYYISPLLLLVDMLILIKIFLTICWKYRPKICWIENLYAALVVGVLRQFRLCGKSIYIPGDWVVGDQNKQLLRYIGNNLAFPILDYLACKLNDEVVYNDEKIVKARYKFWGRKIAKREKTYSPIYFPGLSIKANNSDTARNAICFLGDMRLDSGLDIVIKSLFDIRKQKDVVLKIIGPKRQTYEYFTKLAKECRVEAYVEFLGFIKTEKLVEILDDCFCGINMLTSVNSYSNYAIPGKQIHYLQFLLPIITTENSGTLVSVIKEKALGIVIEPSQRAFKEAIISVHEEQAKYRRNIIEFINSIQRTSVRELIEA